ncbi:MAG: helix-turn-helix transcriptional regulator [Caulobacter sp.]|nr:helix-turn-helix transcriptional regulator [Vitreoscilla sp.]
MTDAEQTELRRRFGLRLASLRKSLGWSQEQLSLESGVARSYLGGVERGRHNIALVNICRLAETLGVKPYALLDLDGEL